MLKYVQTMSQITSIEQQQKDKTRCSVYIDGAFYCGLKIEVAVKYRLKPGDEIEKSRLDEIQFENEKLQAVEKAMNHLSATMAIDCIADIARIGEDKNISFEDLRVMLGKIMASKIDDNWAVAPIKKSVQKLVAKLNFHIDEFDLNAMTR